MKDTTMTTDTTTDTPAAEAAPDTTDDATTDAALRSLRAKRKATHAAMTGEFDDAESVADAVVLLNERLAELKSHTAAARDDLEAAKAARGTALVTGELTDEHSAQVLNAREALALCLEAEAALTDRVNALRPTPGATSTLTREGKLFDTPADADSVQVRVIGDRGQWVCNLPSTGERLYGESFVTLSAADVMTLASLGHVLPSGATPSWWPRSVPIPDATIVPPPPTMPRVQLAHRHMARRA